MNPYTCPKSTCTLGSSSSKQMTNRLSVKSLIRTSLSIAIALAFFVCASGSVARTALAAPVLNTSTSAVTIGDAATFTGSGFLSRNFVWVSSTNGTQGFAVSSNDGQSFPLYLSPNYFTPGSYSLYLSNDNGASNSVNLTVLSSGTPTSASTPTPLPTISFFTASPSTITPGQASALSWSTSNATTVTITGLSNLSTYGSRAVSPAQTTTYTLTATNSGGSVTTQVTVNVVTAPTIGPSTPTNLTATAVSSSQINLSWTPSTVSMGGPTAYEIFRNGSLIKIQTETTYDDVVLTPSTAYTYTVKAVDPVGNLSPASNSIRTTTQAQTQVASSAPVITGYPQLVTLEQIATFSGSNFLPHNYIYLSNLTTGTQHTFSISSNDTTSLSFYFSAARSIEPGNYTMIVANDNGQSNTVNFVVGTAGNVTVTAPAISSFTANPTSVTAGQLVLLSWNVSGATTITIDNGIGEVTGQVLKLVTPAQTTTYTLTATNSVGSSTAPVTVTVAAIPVGGDTTPPTPPVINAGGAPSPTQINISWLPSTDNVGVAGYQIFRNAALVKTQTSTTFSDTGLSPSTKYTYIVKAYDAANNVSDSSNQTTIGTPAQAYPTPTISSFTANPTTVTAGQPVLLSWNVSGATTITIDNGIGEVTNQTLRVVTPAQTTTYTLTAANNQGVVTAKTTVTVAAAGTSPDETSTTTPIITPGSTTTSTTSPVITASSAISSSQISISWLPPTAGGRNIIYDIFRNGNLIALQYDTNFIDIGLVPSNTYTYIVKAYNLLTNMLSASNQVTVTTPAH